MSITSLQEETLFQIFSLLPVRSFLACKKVCKVWRTVIANPNNLFWQQRHLNLQPKMILPTSNESSIIYLIDHFIHNEEKDPIAYVNISFCNLSSFLQVGNYILYKGINALDILDTNYPEAPKRIKISNLNRFQLSKLDNDHLLIIDASKKKIGIVYLKLGEIIFKTWNNFFYKIQNYKSIILVVTCYGVEIWNWKKNTFKNLLGIDDVTELKIDNSYIYVEKKSENNKKANSMICSSKKPHDSIIELNNQGCKSFIVREEFALLRNENELIICSLNNLSNQIIDKKLEYENDFEMIGYYLTLSYQSYLLLINLAENTETIIQTSTSLKLHRIGNSIYAFSGLGGVYEVDHHLKALLCLQNEQNHPCKFFIGENTLVQATEGRLNIWNKSLFLNQRRKTVNFIQQTAKKISTFTRKK